MELAVEQKRDVLLQKLQLEHQRYYSHQVDAKVAQDIGGMEQALAAAQANMVATRKVIDALERILEELKDEQDRDA